MSFNIAGTDKKRIVIVGGGFGGLKLANELHKVGFQIILVDKNNYHQFPPLIYQVASSGLEPSSISFPFRKLFNGYKDIHFCIGDQCLMTEDKNYPNGHPQLAQVAIQQGRLLAKNLKRLNQGKAMRPFRYKNLGTMATVGRNKAVAEFKTVKTQGWLAWICGW